MINFLLSVLQALWRILEDASVYLLFGFLIAGVLAVLVPRQLLSRLIGTGKIRSVLWGSVLGAPLPLCSCGVLPTAVGLRKEGATPGATVAFLVATPETGADSISLTYALTDPLMTVFRPIAGVLTAIAACILTNLFGVTRRPVARMTRDRTMKITLTNMMIRRRRLTSMVIRTTMPNSPLWSSRSSPAGRQGWSWVR